PRAVARPPELRGAAPGVMRADVLAGGGGALALDEGVRERLRGRVARAVEVAVRRGRPVLVSVSQPIDAGLDVAAAVVAGRTPGERCFCLEQPDRDGFALAALGEAATIDGPAGGEVRSGAAGGRA